jgi:calcium/calmodulin-dependent protein kinase (CaM kinase) II
LGDLMETAMDDEQELLRLSQRLIDCIAAADWATYEELCDPGLTAFEPEARGHRVEGLDFHRFYFDLGARGGARNSSLVGPRVQMLGADAAVVTYVRLVQTATDAGAVTSRFEETRVWQRRDGRWWHVHFHRSTSG